MGPAVGVVGCALLATFLGCGKADGDTESSNEPPVVFIVTGTVAKVPDGDDLELEGGLRIRLSDIDAPESGCRGRPDSAGQPHAEEAQRSLEQLAPRGSSVYARCFETDRYGRPICQVLPHGQGGAAFNQEQLRRGWAWLASRGEWIRDPSSRIALEEAKTAKRGIWRDAHPESPSLWKRRCREERR